MYSSLFLSTARQAAGLCVLSMFVCLCVCVCVCGLNIADGIYIYFESVPSLCEMSARSHS